MEFYEAMKLLQNGKKVRLKRWEEGFICKGESGLIIDQDGELFDYCTLDADGEWEEYIEGKAINVATKIEEITTTFMPKDGTEYAIKENFRIIFNKLNEVIKELNRRNENEKD